MEIIMSNTKFTIKASDMNRREVSIFICPVCDSWEFSYPKPEDTKEVFCTNCFEIIEVIHN